LQELDQNQSIAITSQLGDQTKTTKEEIQLNFKEDNITQINSFQLEMPQDYQQAGI
jgi:hypothetical protein